MDIHKIKTESGVLHHIQVHREIVVSMYQNKHSFLRKLCKGMAADNKLNVQVINNSYVYTRGN